MEDCLPGYRTPSRREVIAGAGASALALTAGPGFAPRSLIASGSVFEARSGSVQRRHGDPGLADVLVSNGRDIACTDADGRWWLPVAQGDSVFVIKPSSWDTPHTPHGLPRFSYLHHPLGSPVAQRHAGVAPTGPLPASIDFALTRRTENTRFEAILLSDTQPENEAELAYLRDDIIAGLIGSEAAFGINHGDVVADDLSLYPRYLELLRPTGVRWHHCPGNHDLNWDAADDHYARETWKRVFGPRHYAFQYGQATFIILDNVHYAGRQANSSGNGSYAGRFGDGQLQFVRNLLKHVPREHLVVVSMHIPLASHDHGSNPADSTVDRQALLQLLSDRPHTLSLSGHMHTTEHHYLGAETGFSGPEPHHHHVLTAASGSWWCGPRDRRGIPCADSVDGTPNGVHILSVDGSHYTTRFVPAAGKNSAQLRIVIARNGAQVASRIPIDQLAACEIVANVFDGGPKTAVTCEIKGADVRELPMERVSARDPFMDQLLARHDAVRKPWVEPVHSTHLWRVRLPGGLSPGAHGVVVQAVDEYGRRHISRAVIEVVARQASNAI